MAEFGIGGVRRRQHHGVTIASEVLHGPLVPGNPGHHEVAGLGGPLDPHDHVVAVQDAGVDHGLATDPEHEQVAVARELGG